MIYGFRDDTVPGIMQATLDELLKDLRSDGPMDWTETLEALEYSASIHMRRRIRLSESVVKYGCRFPQVANIRLKSTRRKVTVAAYYAMEQIGGREMFLKQIGTLAVLLVMPDEMRREIPVHKAGYSIDMFWQTHMDMVCLLHAAMDTLREVVRDE